MKIDIWSDFTCPWCYIGKINLEKALKKENILVEYVYHSFQTVVKGYYPIGKSYSIYEIAQKEGMTKAQSIQKANLIEKMGKEAGVVLNMKDLKMTDTTNAHRLLQLAHKYGCQDAFMMESYCAVFTEGANIGDADVLKRLAVHAGMPEKEVITLLETDNYIKQVHADILNAKKSMITGVPYYLFDNTDSIYGSQPVEAFQRVISKIQDKKVSIGACCSNGKCQ